MNWRAAWPVFLLLAAPAWAQGGALPDPTPGFAAPGVAVPGVAAPPMAMPDPLVFPDMSAPDTGMPDASAPDASTPEAGGVPAPGNAIYSGTGLPPLPGSAPAFTCPTMHGGRLLASSDVYDGTPLRGMPVPSREGEWKLAPHSWPGDAYYLSCEYGVDRPPLGIRLPQRVRACRRSKDDPTQVSCL